MKLNKQHHRCGIYCIRNLINGKVYIGKSKDIYVRINIHRCHFRGNNDTEHSIAFKEDWKLYGEENFEYFVLEFLELDEELVRKQELYWIKLYNATNAEKGYNLRTDSETNMIVHEKTSKKISDRLKKEWADGIRDNHGQKLKKNWENNIERKEEQSKLLSKIKTKYLYNIYDLNDQLLYFNIDYSFLKEMGLQHVQATFYKQKQDRVKCKAFLIERVKIEDIVRHS